MFEQVKLIKADDSDTRYLLPLPCDEDSPKLFGLWTYEFRVGHDRPADPEESFWSTAQGRFGAPLIVNSIQHPPPTLICKAYRTTKGIRATAPYASAVLDGTTLGNNPRNPRSSFTVIWFLVYAQAQRLDRGGHRNILIARQKDSGTIRDGPQPPFVQASQAHTLFNEDSLQIRLKAYGFLPTAPLSVLAVEMSPVYGKKDQAYRDPLGGDLGKQRILRTSPLVPVDTLCAQHLQV